MYTHRPERVAALAASVFIALMLAACLAVGLTARLGRLPSFFVPVSFADRTVIFFSGVMCSRTLPRSACETGSLVRGFEITYWAPGGDHLLLSITDD